MLVASHNLVRQSKPEDWQPAGRERERSPRRNAPGVGSGGAGGSDASTPVAVKVDLLPSEDPSHVKSIAIIGPSISWVGQCTYALQSSSLHDDSGYATCGESLDSTCQNAVNRPAYLDQGLAWISQRRDWIRY